MPQPFGNQNYYNPYPQTVQPPMDRMAQLQAQQYQQPTPMPAVNQPPQANQGILWVQGESGAKSYLVAPNTTVLLMDSEGSRFYLKSTDNAGMPSLRVFEYSEVQQNTPQAQNPAQIDLGDKYATREEYNDLNSKYMEILDRLNSFPDPAMVSENGSRSAKTANKSRTKGGDSNE